MILRPAFFSLIFFLFGGGCRIAERTPDLFPVTNVKTELSAGTPLKGVLTRVGAASSAFVPDKPVALSGFGALGRRFVPPLFLTGGNTAFCRPYEKIENPPLIRAAVFELQLNDGTSDKLFLISLDLVAVTADLTRKIHDLIKAVAPNSEPSTTNTIVVATHTHSGPAGLTENPLWSAFVCDRFNAQLTASYLDKLSKTLKTALSRTENIQSIRTQSVLQPELFASRFSDMPAAAEIKVVSFSTSAGSTPLSLLQLAAHPTFFGTRDLILSSDLVAPVETAVKNSIGAQEVFLLQTAVGNMNAQLAGESRERWAAKVSEALKIQGESNSISDLKMSAIAGHIPLPEPQINWQACDQSLSKPFVSLPILKSLPRSAPFSLWSFAKTKHLFISGEWTTAAEAKIKDDLKDSFQADTELKIFSLAHDYTAYHVAKKDYTKKELESCSSLYGDSAVDDISHFLRSADLNGKL